MTIHPLANVAITTALEPCEDVLVPQNASALLECLLLLEIETAELRQLHQGRLIGISHTNTHLGFQLLFSSAGFLH